MRRTLEWERAAAVAVGIWALGAHAGQDYEASEVESLQPRKFIYLGLVTGGCSVQSRLNQGE
jgi:hypothetical protein